MAPADQQQAQAILDAVSRLSCVLQNNEPLEKYWSALSDALDLTFSHTSCTVLAYDPTTQTLVRLYSSRPDIHRVGGRKRVTDSFWTRTVLQEGRILVGSTLEELKSYFSEHETLKAHGWESVLNIPVKDGGTTIGSINLHNGPHAYDDASHATATIFAQLTVPALRRAYGEAEEAENTENPQELEYV